MKKYLINLANRLDASGLHIEANHVDRLIVIASQDEESETESETVPDQFLAPSHPKARVNVEHKADSLFKYDEEKKNNPNARFPYSDLDAMPINPPNPAILESQENERKRGEVINIDIAALQRDLFDAKTGLGIKSKNYFDMASNAIGQLEAKRDNGRLDIDKCKNFTDVLNIVKYAFKLDSERNFSSERIKSHLIYGEGGPLEHSRFNPYMRSKEDFYKGLEEIFYESSRNPDVGHEIAIALDPYIGTKKYETTI